MIFLGVCEKRTTDGPSGSGGCCWQSVNMASAATNIQSGGPTDVGRVSVDDLYVSALSPTSTFYVGTSISSIGTLLSTGGSLVHRLFRCTVYNIVCFD
jgi:hypothetical protein